MLEGLSWLPYVVFAMIVGLPALAGSAMIIGGLVRWNRQRALTGSGERAGARVVDNQMESWSGGRTSYRPVVTFRTAAGAEVTTAVADLDEFRSHIVGTQVDVFYDPAKPQEVTSGRRRTGRLTTTIIFGLVFVGFAVVAFLVGSAVIDDFGGFGGFGGGEDVSDFGDLDGFEGP